MKLLGGSLHPLNASIIVLLLGLLSCSQTASQPTARPPLLPAEQAQDVVRVLDLTDPLDKMIRAGNAGQPFVDLAARVQLEYLNCQQTLPQDNAARLEFRRIVDGYSIASSIIAGKVTNTSQTPFDLVAEAYTRKKMLKVILEGRATERQWRAFELGTKSVK